MPRALFPQAHGLDLGEAEQAAAAREFTVRVLRSGFGGQTTARSADDVTLAVSELVGNALTHSAGPVHLSLRATDMGLVVEVRDTTERPAELRRPRADGSGGFGLHIVDSLADNWGNRPLDGGKTVWALFRWQPG